MNVISAADIAAPVLPCEEVVCPPLGGAVRVRALLLSQRLALEAKVGALRAKHADSPDAATYAVIPEMLTLAVVDVKDQPVYSHHRWEVFGAQHPSLALELFNTAWRLSGMSGVDAKKN